MDYGGDKTHNAKTEYLVYTISVHVAKHNAISRLVKHLPSAAEHECPFLKTRHAFITKLCQAALSLLKCLLCIKACF